MKFWVKLKKKATETFEMFKSAYDEACLSRTRVFGHPEEKNRRKSLKIV
jgi:hypothetical protein